MQWINFNRPAFLVGVVLLSLAAGAATAAVTINSINDTNRLYAAQDDLNDTNNLTVSNMDFDYKGLNATQLTVTVQDDSGTTTDTHNFDVHIQLWDSTGGAVVYNENVTGQSVTGGSTTDVTFSGMDDKVDTFDMVDVNVEETSVA